MSRIQDALTKAENETPLPSEEVIRISRIHDALSKAEHEVSDTSMAAVAMGGGLLQAALEQEAGNENRKTHLPLEVTDFPVRSWSPDRGRLIFTDTSEERLAIEQLRSLRSRIYQIHAKRPMQTILISSALGGEGKTFISANFALALAKQDGKKVLLMDADLRKPGLHELFGAPVAPGLTEHLAGAAELREVIQRGAIENLWLLPAGAPAPNAPEILGSGRIAGMLEKLTSLFDWIIIDSSPVLPVSDAVVISRLCDAVLLVARAEVTPRESVQRAQHEFREARVLGLVLNSASEPGRRPKYYARHGQGKEKSKSKAASRKGPISVVP